MMFSIIPRLYFYGAIVAAAVVGFAWFVHSIRKDARDDLLQKIERTEDAARTKAISGARSVDACYDAGGVWDRAAGACREPQGSR
jgi:hypothetical protein